MHLLRGNIGAGVFGMGDAFKNGGIILSPILTVALGLTCVHAQHTLVFYWEIRKKNAYFFNQFVNSTFDTFNSWIVRKKCVINKRKPPQTIHILILPKQLSYALPMGHRKFAIGQHSYDWWSIYSSVLPKLAFAVFILYLSLRISSKYVIGQRKWFPACKNCNCLLMPVFNYRYGNSLSNGSLIYICASFSYYYPSSSHAWSPIWNIWHRARRLPTFAWEPAWHSHSITHFKTCLDSANDDTLAISMIYRCTLARRCTHLKESPWWVTQEETWGEYGHWAWSELWHLFRCYRWRMLWRSRCHLIVREVSWIPEWSSLLFFSPALDSLAIWNGARMWPAV